MSQQKTTRRLDLLGVVEGYYASELALGLIQCGALEILAAERRVEIVALAVRVDPDLLDRTFDFLARTTDLIDHDGPGRYRPGKYPLAEIVFQLRKFIGAYARSVRLLASSAVAPPFASGVDENSLAAAFAAIDRVPSPVAPRLQKAGCRRLVDLGCGPASLPIEMALADREFRAIGLDSSRAMCRLARSRTREAGVASRVRIERADVREICDLMDVAERRSVEAVHARSVINAFFGRGFDLARGVLRKLRLAFPGRVAFFIDYYGELNHPPKSKPGFRLAQIHDLAQLASGQGIPPASRPNWRALYRAAGCKLISADDFCDGDIRWFVHEVRLAP